MKRDGKATKARIEKVALRLFVEKGVTETTIRDIAGGAGIAEGTIYRHFQGKEDLVRELLFKYQAGFAGALGELARDAAGIRDKLDAIVRAFCRLFDADSTLFSFLLILRHPKLRAPDGQTASPTEVLRDVIAEAMDRGRIPAGDPELAAAMVLGVLLRSAIFIIDGRIERPLIARADEISSACWRVLNP